MYIYIYMCVYVHTHTHIHTRTHTHRKYYKNMHKMYEHRFRLTVAADVSNTDRAVQTNVDAAARKPHIVIVLSVARFLPMPAGGRHGAIKRERTNVGASDGANKRIMHGLRARMFAARIPLCHVRTCTYVCFVAASAICHMGSRFYWLYTI